MSKRERSRTHVLMELGIDGLLLVGFLIQVFLLVCVFAYGHLPLPTNWVSEAVTERLPEGLSISADSYSLSPGGTIRLEGVQFRLPGFEEAVFHAGSAHINFGARWDRHRPFFLKECILLEGLLTLPAVYSPDGKDKAILDHIALRLRPAEHGVTVDSFAARHEDIRLRGSIDWKTAKRPGDAVKVPEQADRFFRRVANLLKQKQQFNGFSEPTILFNIDSGSDSPSNVFSKVSCRSYERRGIRARNLTLDARFPLSDEGLDSPSSIWLEADEVEIPSHRTRASFITAKVEPEEWGVLLEGNWPNMKVAAESLQFEDLELETPQIEFSPKAFPLIAFSGYTSGHQRAVEFSGSFNARTRAAEIRAEGSLDLLSLAPESLTARWPTVKIKEPPYYNLSLDFDEGFALKRAELRGRIDGLAVEGLHFDHIRFKSDYKEGVYSINRLELRRQWQWLELGFRFDASVDNYALRLKGFLKPDDYNPVLPRWWAGIFKEFDFENVEDGLGDFVIYGNTKQKAAGFFFGHAKAKNVDYKDVHVDEGELIVRGRGAYAEVHQLNARSGDGYVRGDIRFASRLDEVRGPLSVRLDLDTKLPLSAAEKLFDEDIAGILADFETDSLPRASLRGAIFNDAYPEFAGLSHIDLTVNCPAPLNYKGLSLDKLRFDLKGRADITYLRDIKIGYAGGFAVAEADILRVGEGPARTRFRLSLEDADQAQAVNQLTALKKNRKNPQEKGDTAQARGRLELELHASGSMANPLEMKGYGSFQIKNEALYAIQLFGPLSTLLQNIRFGFTSFALDEMFANFALENKTVQFDRIEVNGPRTRIEATGTMGLEDLALAMRVSVYLFGNAGSPESNIRKFSNLISNPIPNILEFELTGTADDPNWRSLYDPRKFIPLF